MENNLETASTTEEQQVVQQSDINTISVDTPSTPPAEILEASTSSDVEPGISTDEKKQEEDRIAQLANAKVPAFLVKEAGSKYLLPLHEVKDGTIRTLVSSQYLSKGVVPDEAQMTELSLVVDICRGDHTSSNARILGWDGADLDADGNKLWKDSDGKLYSPDDENVIKLSVEFEAEKEFYYVPGADITDESMHLKEDQVIKEEDRTYVLAVKEMVPVQGNSGVTHESILHMLLYDLQMKNAGVNSANVAQAIIRLREAMMWLTA